MPDRPAMGSTSTRAKDWIWINVIALCAVSFIFFGWLQWPGLHWDAGYYAPIVLNVSKGLGWVFEGYAPNLLAFPNRQVNGHGIIAPMFFGGLLRASTWDAYFMAIGLVNSATFLVYALLYRKVLAAWPRLSLLLSGVLSLMAGMIAVSLQGRPEHLVPLELTIPFIAYYLSRRSRRVAFVVASLTTGLVFVTSPLPGIMVGLACVVLLSLAASELSLRFWKHLFGLVILSWTFAALLISLMAPVNLFAWFKNTFTVGLTSPDFTHQLFKPLAKGDLFWGFTGFFPLWNLLVATLLAIAMVLLLCRKSFFAIVILVTSAIVIAPKAADYSYSGLIPAIFLSFLWIDSERIAPMSFLVRVPQRIGRSVFQMCLLLFAAPYVLGFARAVHQSWLHFQDKTLAANQMNILGNLSAGNARKKKNVYAYPGLYSPSLVSLGPGDSYELMSVWNYAMVPGRSKPIDRLEKQETIRITHFLLPKDAFEASNTPPERIFLGDVEFKLIRNHWQRIEPTILGKTRIPDRFSQGYDFAVYQRQ